MNLYCSHQTPNQPAAGQPYLGYARLNGQDKGVNEWFGAPDLSSPPLTPSEVEEYNWCQSRRTQEANSRWARPNRPPIWTNGPCTVPHQGTIPVVQLGNGYDLRQWFPGEDHRHSQRKPRPNLLNPAVGDYGQRQSLGTRPEYLRYKPTAVPRRLDSMGISDQQYYHETMAQRALPSVQMPSFQVPSFQVPSVQMLPEPSNYPLPQSSRDTWNPQEVELQRLAQQRRDEQRREQEKAQLPKAKPGSSYPKSSRNSGPVRTAHDHDMERRAMSNRTFPLQHSSGEIYREAYHRYPADKARKEGEERRKAAVSVPTPEPTRTESVKQLLSSVNEALEQKVEAAELETADTKCSDSEALRAQSQQLQQDQKVANQTARQCGESFWNGYSANYPTAGCSSMTTQWPQSSKSVSAQSLLSNPGLMEGEEEDLEDRIRTCLRRSQSEQEMSDHRPATPGHLKGEEDLADRIRNCLRRSQSEHSLEMSDHRPATGPINKVPGVPLKGPRTALGQEDGSSSLEPPVDSTSRDSEKSALDGPHVPLASHKDLSVTMSVNHGSSLPVPQAKETNVGPEVRAHDRNFENGSGAGLLGYVDVESEWEEVDDELGDKWWSDVDEDVVQRESSDLEWASEVGSEGAFYY